MPKKLMGMMGYSSKKKKVDGTGFPLPISVRYCFMSWILQSQGFENGNIGSDKHDEAIRQIPMYSFLRLSYRDDRTKIGGITKTNRKHKKIKMKSIDTYRARTAAGSTELL